VTTVCIPNCAFLSETSRQIAIYKALMASGMPAVLATRGGPHGFLFDQKGVPCTRLDPKLQHMEAAHYLAAIFNPLPRFQDSAVLREHVIKEITRISASSRTVSWASILAIRSASAI
jgi:hypothetical protein